MPVHDGDQWGGLQWYCYGTIDQLSGKQGIKFRMIINAYPADMAATMSINTNNGSVLTIDQMETVAVNAINIRIDAIEYDGLLQTIL